MNFLECKFVELLNQFGISIPVSLVLFSIIPFCIIIAFLVFVVLILVLAERKLLGWFTQRKGPNRVGIWGILQTVADAIKLLCKENIELLSGEKFLFSIAPLLAFTSVIMLWCLIPYNAEFHIIDSTIGLLLYFVIAGLPMLFHFLAGYSSNNKYALLGAYRGLSITASYTLPMIFVLMSIVFITKSMDLNNIVQYQTNGWLIFYDFIGFAILYISAIAKLNRCPFDLVEAESEIICGYHTEYSGMRFAMFFLGEYAEFFVMSALIVILFFGGYLPPFDIYLSNIFLGNCSLEKYLIYFEQTIWLLIKTSIIIFSIIWIRATLPRLTQVSILKLFWKYLMPASIINLIILIILNMGIFNE